MTLREDALAIWQSGVAAVDSVQLVKNAVTVDSEHLTVCSETVELSGIGRIEVVGAGKAGAGMTTGLLQALHDLPSHIVVSGWVNVPEDCVQPVEHIHLHAARPAGVNEPTAAGVAGTQEILKRIAALGPDDVCIVLISGGGSALLPAPVAEVTLEEKLAVTRLLAGGGATIQELNIVRSQLSDVKGGGLLRRCGAGRIITLIISDVIGDPLDLIASGPTQPSSYGPADAIRILKQYDPSGDLVPAAIGRYLQSRPAEDREVSVECANFIVGSNAVAVSAAAAMAERLGYEVLTKGSANAGEATHHGQQMFRELQQQRDSRGSDERAYCLLAGGETTVTLAETSQERKGGRNQEVVLGAIAAQPSATAWNDIVLLSGGTDGEDGPTDAAGAMADAELVTAMQRAGMTAAPFLQINNSYPFFCDLHGLIRCGPTHTNVMDLAVGLVGRG